eukprot:Nk52_evm1s254 gene=Nk52_evmTU1s254
MTQEFKLQAVETTAPGKLILFGEHAVVHGVTAIASALDLRASCSIVLDTDSKIILDLPDLNASYEWELSEIQAVFKREWFVRRKCEHTGVELEEANKDALLDNTSYLYCIEKIVGLSPKENVNATAAAKAFLHLFTAICPFHELNSGVRFIFNSDLPIGAGLGSSAALSTSFAAGLLVSCGVVKEIPQSIEVVNAWAFNAERIIHGNPSGIDNTVSSYGSALTYRRKEKTPFEVLDSMPRVRVILCNTKVPRSTKTLVAGVGAKKAKYPNIINPIFDSIEGISAEFLSLVEDSKAGTAQDTFFDTLKALMEMNHCLLKAIGVSHPSLEKVCTTASEFGFGAKLTGAGGGGCAFILVPDNCEELQVKNMCSELEKCGFSCYDTFVGGRGVCRE